MSSDQPHTGTEPDMPPPGHSIAAHRVLGWCVTCPGHTFTDEALAWRAADTRAQRLREEALQANPQAASSWISVTSEDTRCPECGEQTLTTVSVHLVQPDEGPPRHIGGWALCAGCGATPHPLWEPDRG
ncbi:hypothetical protein OG896_24590 [Streptomyces sp. NBC_00669]|uniref:hypothetical protein n=1 Tax=Streptomyces sp. NBC_00669 TaxID=2976011 RepID=UPI002E30584A|nr:hypothetical protein [Streptomyces sp. NBC_00669]